MENKLKIIDAICERHPSLGVKKGWSEYVGGMKDTGEWFLRKMLNQSEEELQSFLDELIAEENKPVIPLTPQEQADSKIFYKMDGYVISKYDLEKMIQFTREQEIKLLFNK